jgi:hypothetical protein
MYKFRFETFSGVSKGHTTTNFKKHLNQPVDRSFSLIRGETSFDFVASSEKIKFKIRKDWIYI